jgi:hypothetical protein
MYRRRSWTDHLFLKFCAFIAALGLLGLVPAFETPVVFALTLMGRVMFYAFLLAGVIGIPMFLLKVLEPARRLPADHPPTTRRKNDQPQLQGR